MKLADLSPSARRLYFRLRNLVLQERARACTCCGRALYLASADYLRFVAADDGAALLELLEASALLGVFDSDGRCRGAAVIVDFGNEGAVP